MGLPLPPCLLSSLPLDERHEGLPIPVEVDAPELEECLRPLTDPERQSIRVRRLRSAAATAEETLAGFSTRTGNTWKLPRLAVVNDLFVESELQGGQLLKVAIEEAYVPLARPSPAPASP